MQRPSTQVRVGGSIASRFAMLLAGCAAVVALAGWGPSLRDPSSQNELSGDAASALHGERPPLVIARAFILVDGATGRTLYSYRSEVRREIASITKLMTALVVMDHIPETKVVTISVNAAGTPGSTMGLTAGERLTVRSLLYGLLLPSGNDAAVALAEATAGSVPRFATMMNEKARAIGLTNSHFVTPHGLDTPGQFSCARDVAIMAQAVLRNPALASIVRTSRTEVRTVGGGVTFRLASTDQLLGRYRGAIGVKTGTTTAAGASIVSAATRSGHTLLAAVLGSDLANDGADRFTSAANLLNFGYLSYTWPALANILWSTPSLLGRSPVPAPVPAWEAAWIRIGPSGLATVPVDTD